MKKFCLLSTIVALLLGVTACQSKKMTTTNSNLLEKHWKLVEIFGEPLTNESETAKSAYLILKAEGNQVVGNSSCNNIHGTYTLGTGNRLSFSQMVSTQMMCLNMDIETKLNKVLETTDSYYLNGDTLILNRARMAPLARFEALYR